MPAKTPGKKPKATLSKPAAKKKPSAKPTAPKKTAAKKAAAKKLAPKKPAAKKPTVKKPAVKKPALKKPATKKPAVKKLAVKKPTPKKLAPKKPTTKKPASKKPARTAAKQPAPKPATGTPAQSGAADFESVYKIPQLAKRAGTATIEEVRAQVAVPEPQLIEQGSQVATGRITTDCARNYGQALDIFTNATPKIKSALLGINHDVIRIAIFAAQHGDELYASRNQGLAEQKVRQDARRNSTAATLAQGAARRDQLHALYLAVTGDEPTWRGRIDAAYGAAKDSTNLAKALVRLLDLGAEILNSTDSEILARQKNSGLTSELLASIRSQAEQIGLLGPAGEAARELSPVSQAEVDLWDGLNLVLLERMMNLFNAAHDFEPSIPRLTPIALRTYFFGSGSKKAATPKAADPA